MHSLFSQVDVSLNGVSITNQVKNYPYRAYIENLFSYGPDAKMSQLTSALFYKDDPGKMDKHNPKATNEADRNSGLVKRAAFIAGSKELELVGRIHADIFYQMKYMLNEVTVNIKLHPSNANFCLMGDGAFKVDITHAKMYVHRVKISPSIYLAHANALEHGTAKYPIKRVVCKAETLAGGILSTSIERLFSGQLPSRLIIGFVTNKAYSGHMTANPFNFQHFSVTDVAVKIDGNASGIKPLENLNYTTGNYITAYKTLFSGLGKENHDEGNDIDRLDYPRGFTLYAFDLTPDLSDNENFNLVRNGTVRIDISFDTALTEAVSLIAYAEFENVIEIDRSRNVVFDINN